MRKGQDVPGAEGAAEGPEEIEELQETFVSLWTSNGKIDQNQGLNRKRPEIELDN